MWFLIPVAAVLGKLAYDYIKDDSSSTSSSSSSSSEREQQARAEYQQQQKNERSGLMKKQICDYAAASANTIIDQRVGVSLKSNDITMDNVIAFARTDITTPDQAVGALSSLTGRRMKLVRKSEQQQLITLEKEQEELTWLVELLAQEKDKLNGSK